MGGAGELSLPFAVQVPVRAKYSRRVSQESQGLEPSLLGPLG